MPGPLGGAMAGPKGSAAAAKVYSHSPVMAPSPDTQGQPCTRRHAIFQWCLFLGQSSKGSAAVAKIRC